MKFAQRRTFGALAIVSLWCGVAGAATLDYAGTHFNVGGTFFPGGSFPYTVVPWHSDSVHNTFAISNSGPDRYYGTAGYALFATQFTFPNQNIGYNGVAADPTFTDFFTDVVDLPDFVTDSVVLSLNKSAGWEYALIDDPRLQEGERYWTFDGVNYPPPDPPEDPTNQTGGIPYVKVGILQGNDIFGNNPGTAPAARWGFEVGNDIPEGFRIGVMTDGLDGNQHAPTEVFLSQVVDDEPVSVVSTSTLVRNRFVDIHFFDIHGAQPGDRFVVAAMRGELDSNAAGVSGFTFDILSTTTLEGDFNNDGSVDAADYVVWRKNNGTVEEYNTWRDNFGETLGGGSSGRLASVPEPATLSLLCLAGAALLFRSGRRQLSR